MLYSDENLGGGNDDDGVDESQAERRSLLLLHDRDETARDETSQTTAATTSPAAAAAVATGMNPQDDLEASADFSAATTPASSPSLNSMWRKRPNSLQGAPTTPTAPAATAITTAASDGADLTATATATTILNNDLNNNMVSRRKSRKNRRRHRSNSEASAKANNNETTTVGPLDAVCTTCLRTLCFDRTMVRNTLSCMNVMARVLVWASFVFLVAAIVWYSKELINNGTEKHLIAWFSAGAFVLLGFPLSISSIVGHLSNYNQPHVQCYIVRILWMVPIYSIESWLCLKYHEKAIYIETLRDCYESFVLYSFFQYLIEVLGGEEALILMLKDKSPTRGSHMWGLQWCVKPWLMGQPVRRNNHDDTDIMDSTSIRRKKKLQRVHWKSPFFTHCKFGILQYVLLKFVCSFMAVILESFHLYKEGDFTPKGGYLYICIITNTSQCWALYCLILFYYATHNELSPIRPVGKFLSVKALVFFTWWQSVGISILYQMDMLPHYTDSKLTVKLSPEDVAKGIQDYLICIEMFFAAIVHTLVFPHTEYSPQAVQARARALNQSATNPSLSRQRKRMGRHSQFHTNGLLRNYHHIRDDKSANSDAVKSNFTGEDRSFFDLEMTTLSSVGAQPLGVASFSPSWEEENASADNRARTVSADSIDSDLSPATPAGAQGWARLYKDEPTGWTTPKSESDNDSAYQQITHPTMHLNQPSSLVYPKPGNDQSTIEEGVEPWETESGSGDEKVAGDSSEGDDSNDEDSDAEYKPKEKQSFVRAFLDSAIPRDLRDNTVGIVKGDYVVEKKTLLHHATTSDHYDLFSSRRYFRNAGSSPDAKHK